MILNLPPVKKLKDITYETYVKYEEVCQKLDPQPVYCDFPDLEIKHVSVQGTVQNNQNSILTNISGAIALGTINTL